MEKDDFLLLIHLDRQSKSNGSSSTSDALIEASEGEEEPFDMEKDF